MPRRRLLTNVFEESVDRMRAIYREGHRVVISFSAGKDSGVCLEVCREAAALEGGRRVEVILRDEEINFPGTYEYSQRVYEMDDVDLHHVWAEQPMINVFNRKQPYWWIFDSRLKPEEWVRQPPDYAYKIPELNIDSMTIPSRFPPPKGKDLYSVVGLRTAESRGRMYGIFSAGGHILKPNRHGVIGARPVYDWEDGDIWKAHADFGWDYNRAYDVMHRMGVKRRDLRIAPPVANAPGIDLLGIGAAAWPRWFDRVCKRLPGIRTAANFGAQSVNPKRKLGESWEECFQRQCVDEAPEWIRQRSVTVRDKILNSHRAHSTTPLPEIKACYSCKGNIGSWKQLTMTMFNGDPFCVKIGTLVPYVEPEEFRTGAGLWGGKPL